MATQRPFVVDPALTAIAIGYRNPDVNLIADLLLPRVPVGGEKFEWQEYPLSESLTLPEARVGRRGRVNQIEFSSVPRVDSVDDFGLDAPIPVTDVESAAQQRAAGLSTYDPEARAAMGIVDYLKAIREVRVAAQLQALNTYAPSLRQTLVGTTQFSDKVNSTPIDIINGALDAMLVRANHIAMGRAAWSQLRTHPHIVNAITGGSTGRGNVSKADVAELFEVSQIVVGDGWVNTAKPGQPVVQSRIWGKDIMLLSINRVAGPDMGMTFGYTAEFGGLIAGTIIEPNIGLKGSESKRVGERIKEIVAAQACGFLIKNAVA